MNEEKIYNVISGIDEDLTDRSLSRKTQTKAEKRRTFRWLYAAAAALAVCVIAALPIFSPLLRSPDSPVIDPPASDTCSESSVGDPVDAQTEEPIAYTEYEPPVWAIVANRPFAILKIHEITDEKIILSQNPTSSKDRSYVKITGEIVAAYHTEAFTEGDPILDGSGAEPLPFENVAAIYFTDDTVSQLQPGDTVLFYVIKMNRNAVFYYGPATNEHGLSEYLPIKNGKIRIKPEDFNTFSFAHLQVLNDAVREHQRYSSEAGFPTQCVEDGMTIEELTEFFKSWDSAVKSYREERKQSPYPNMIIVY